MKFFKHFTDADDGTLNDLMNKHGVEAYARYWLFAEFCIKGLEKPADREFVETDMKFSFNERQLREKLRIKSVNLGIFLGTCAELNLFQVSRVGEKFDIYFPKILKFLDRDSKYTRKKREEIAQKTRQDKEEEKEIRRRSNSRTNSANSPTAAAALFSENSECGAIAQFAKTKEDLLLSALNTVPKSLQETWVTRWEPEWVLKTLEKAVLKTLASGGTLDKAWGEIFTAWLFSERPQSLRKLNNGTWIQPEQDFHEGETLSEMQKKFGAKSALELMMAVTKQKAS